MRRPELTRKNLAVAGGVVAAVILLVVTLLSLTRAEPELRPAASRPTTTTTTTTETPTTTEASTTTAAPPTTTPGLSPLPARTSRVATVRSTAGSLPVYAGAEGSEPARDPIPRAGDYGQAQVFLVLEDQGDRLHVLLPVRPNGSKGWIDADQVTVASHDYQIQVSLAGFQMMIQKGTEVLVDTPVGVGKSDTPTVGGEYYTWVLIDPTNAGYGSYAYGLSGFSTLESFAGGDGRLGIHGDTDPSSFGREVSHGCVRVPDDIMIDLAEDVGLPLGVPVTVQA